MVKGALLVSQTSPARSQIRTRAWAAGPVTFQSTAPSLAVLAKRVCQEPPLRESSIRTLPFTPLEVQAILYLRVMRQASPPFGERTVICAAAPVHVTSRERFPALDEKSTVPGALPGALGVKRTTTDWLAPGARLKDPPETTL